MPWPTGGGRTVPLPPDWRAIRAAIMRRDEGRCQWIRADTGELCGEPATDIHHTGEAGDHDPAKLIALCSFHHQRITSHQGGKAAAAKRAAQQPPHPGMR